MGGAASIVGTVGGGLIGGPAGAAIGGAIGGMIDGDPASEAAGAASGYRADASRAQIAEQRRQFNEIQALLKPYVSAGQSAIGAQQDLLGLGGQDAQKQAIYNLAYGPQMESMVQQGENAIRQNASATGGLRGGNTMAALAQFRPQMLSQLINQQFANLGGITSIGANAASGQANYGMQSSANIQNAMGQIGAAQAGNALAQGQSKANIAGGLAQAAGALAGYGGFGGGASSNILRNLF